MKLFKATKIDWGTDGSDFKVIGLPEEAFVHTDDEESVADMLTDECGFCIKSLTVEEVSTPAVVF